MFATFYPTGISADPDNGVVAGVFIPLIDLPGVFAGEFAANQSDISKECKAVYGLSNAIYSGLSAKTALTGLSITKGNPSGTGTNRFTEQISLTFQWLVDFSSGAITPVPLNTAQDGAASVADIFPNAVIVDAMAAIPGEGLLIPSSVTNKYGSYPPVTLSEDHRDWIYALFLAMVAESTLRSGSVQSAITNRSNLLTIRTTGLLIPAAYYGTEPTTGVTSEALPYSRIFTDTLNLEYECEMNPSTQTLDVKIDYTVI